MAKKKKVATTTKVADTLDVARKAIEKKYGDVLKPMSERPLVIDTISTRCLGLDVALGRGGISMGRIHEIYGENSSGKSTLAMSIIAEAQSRGMSCAYIDAEHSADPALFESMGVVLEDLQVIDAYTGEKNLMVAETLMKTGSLDVLVVDSVTALIPEVMASKDLDEDSIALLARLMSKTLLRYVPIAAETNTCVIFINQTRLKVGGYGNPETTTGGTALGFYSTSRVRVSGIGAKANRLVDDAGEVVGHKTTFEVIKNKLGRPCRKAEANLYYGKGYDTTGEIINIATGLGLLERAGSWYKYNDNNIGQGENGVRAFFNENPEVYDIIKDEVVIMLGLDPFYKAQAERDRSLGNE